MTQLSKLQREIDDLKLQIQRLKSLDRRLNPGFTRIAIVEPSATISGRTRTGAKTWTCSSGTVKVHELIDTGSGYEMSLIENSSNEPSEGTLVNTWRGDVTASSSGTPVHVIAGRLPNKLWIPIAMACDVSEETYE